MKKPVKKKKNHTALKVAALVIFLLILLAELVIFVIPQMLYRQQGETDFPDAEVTESPVVMPEATEPVPTEVEIAETTARETVAMNTAPAVEFPLTLEDGKLEIESLFQFDGINPDCGNEEKDNIATIMVKNTSEFFLIEAKVTLEMADGTIVDFAVTNLPAEKAAMVFSGDNAVLDEDIHCVKVSAEALWGETIAALPEEVAVSVDGVTITLENTTKRDIPEAIVYCHSLLGEEYFGGISYEYKVGKLPANETVTIEAPECIMGLAEVSRIVIN